MPELTKQEIEELILLAATKLNKDEELLDDKDKLQQAVEYFEKSSVNVSSPQELANTALLGVVNSYVTGTIPPIVQFSWGNLTGVADVNPFGEAAGSGAAIDQENRVDFKYGDSLGTEGKSIANFIQAGEFDADFIEYAQQVGFNVEDTTASSPFKMRPEPPK